MTAVLAVVLAVAVLFAAALGWIAHRRGAAVRSAEERVAQAISRVEETAQRLEEVEQQNRAAEVRASAAEGRVRASEQKAAEAERRAGEAERRVGEVMRRAAEAERAGAESDAGRVVWELERLRVEREWLDVVGPGVPLPVPWDGTLAAVVATELSVIREVMGTPSGLSVEDPAPAASPARAAVTARISVELLRTLARSGEEMDVRVEGHTLTVGQPVFAGEAPPDLTALAGVAQMAGIELTVELSEGRSVARLAPA